MLIKIRKTKLQNTLRYLMNAWWQFITQFQTIIDIEWEDNWT